MTVPAYHLRPNKAADRLALMEAIRRLARLGGEGLHGYTYHGFGGPHLEDFRLLYDLYPELGMVSIEEDGETVKRQKFHRPCSYLRMENKNMSSFITDYDPGDAKSIFWLDYTNLKPYCFTDFRRLLEAVADYSMVKITLRSMPDDFYEPNGQPNLRGDAFREDFRGFMPDTLATLPNRPSRFAALLQSMVQIAAQKALPAAAECSKFVPVSSFYYADMTWMFTMTGIVCGEGGGDDIKGAFADWEFANLEWGPPTKISVPVLSTKERLRLQPLLPAETPEETLRDELGYSIGRRTTDALKQYAAFHRYAPYFLRGMP